MGDIRESVRDTDGVATATWRAGKLALAGARLRGFATELRLTLEAELEAGRGFLWLPVAFGVGILVYFNLPREPSVLALALLVASFGVAVRRWRHSGMALRILVAAATVAAGLFVAKVRTDVVAAPVLSREVTATVSGWIAGVEEAANGGRRVRIRVANIDGVAATETPRFARITIRARSAASLSVGDPVSVLAGIGPPTGPVIPGGYDFAFALYFERVGASGFAFGTAKAADLGPAPWPVRLARPLAALRDTLRVRIEEALPGNDGHIAAALIMGDQRGIAEDTQDDMRASGLGHILSISGLHLALVAGSVFWLIRALLALSPALALNFPIKKWAAAATLAVATVYTAISGAEVATVRSWVMLAIMLGAILMDRRALTLRNVALAALVILVFSPESLLSISFQMSFAATIALISAYEVIAARQAAGLAAGDARERTWFTRASASVTTLFLTAVVAGLATAPFGAHYFQRVAPLTIIANMAAAPAVSFVVMPMAMLAVVAMPFGLESLALGAMRWGLEWMLLVADKTAAWSAGLGNVKAMPALALLLMTGGFLWLTLWRRRWRLAGIVPILAALPIAAFAPRPDVIVADDAAAVAVRGADGRLSVLGGKGAAFDVETWLRADGDGRPADSPDIGNGVTCDPVGCLGHLADGRSVALATRREALAEDCLRADIVVSRYDAPPGCDTHALVIDRTASDTFGAHAVYLENGAYRVTTAYAKVRRPFMPPARD
ncbi:MAG TPA: ComEC/Rec2 family competence protein [Bauldia sp.]|nr:ComEC/Rec2 family competence protein [Bauldia sp.]